MVSNPKFPEGMISDYTWWSTSWKMLTFVILPPFFSTRLCGGFHYLSSEFSIDRGLYSIYPLPASQGYKLYVFIIPFFKWQNWAHNTKLLSFIFSAWGLGCSSYPWTLQQRKIWLTIPRLSVQCPMCGL